MTEEQPKKRLRKGRFVIDGQSTLDSDIEAARVRVLNLKEKIQVAKENLEHGV
jgi:hypothetical protein